MKKLYPIICLSLLWIYIFGKEIKHYRKALTYPFTSLMWEKEIIFSIFYGVKDFFYRANSLQRYCFDNEPFSKLLWSFYRGEELLWTEHIFISIGFFWREDFSVARRPISGKTPFYCGFYRILRREVLISTDIHRSFIHVFCRSSTERRAFMD